MIKWHLKADVHYYYRYYVREILFAMCATVWFLSLILIFKLKHEWQINIIRKYVFFFDFQQNLYAYFSKQSQNISSYKLNYNTLDITFIEWCQNLARKTSYELIWYHTNKRIRSTSKRNFVSKKYYLQAWNCLEKCFRDIFCAWYKSSVLYKEYKSWELVLLEHTRLSAKSCGNWLKSNVLCLIEMLNLFSELKSLLRGLFWIQVSSCQLARFMCA